MAKQPTKDDTTKDPAAKAAALKLLSRGLLTSAEAAKLAGVSRQLMRHWGAELDIPKLRSAYLLKIWRGQLARSRRS